jgi:cytochrome oxidase Cu insertion factor (SCO1/SenC/PrrC family)
MRTRPTTSLPRLGALALCGLALFGCQGNTDRAAPEDSPLATARDSPPAAEREEPDCCKLAGAATSATRTITIPDVLVVDQDGRTVRFYSDLVRGKVVAINFVFTSCKATCPLLGATFGKLQEKLSDRLGAEVSLISVSVDPAVDRPARLKEWAGQFGARPGWTLVTAAGGHKADLDALLKALQVYSPEKSDHAQSVLVVDGDSLEGRTSRKVASADDLENMLGQALKTRGSRSYFTDTPLVDQDGRCYRFYSDLVKGKVVVLHCFFTSCKGSCVVMSGSLAKLQERLGDRLGRDVVILSLTVDPATDSVAELAMYAKKCGARPGWHFLTGTKEDLARVQRKLGQFMESRESHTSIMVVGNEATGLWMKHPDPADVEGLYKKVEEALAHDAKAQAAGQ